MLELRGANGSPFVRKVKVFLSEKNLEYKQIQDSPFPASEEFRKISPLGKIPAFKHDDKALADSSVICAYLERIHPSPALYPSKPYDYARALWFEEYGDGGMTPIIGPEMFFNKIIGPRMMKLPFNEEMFRKAETEKLPPMLDYLEGEINGEFLVGESFSIGDIGIGTSLVNAKFAGLNIDPKRWPRLSAYLDRIYARPSFKSCIDQEAKIFVR